MPVFIKDYGDEYDTTKWDIKEDHLPVYVINGYPYKATTLKNAQILELLREKVNQVAMNIEDARGVWENTKNTKNKSYIEGVNVFLGLHLPMLYDPEELPSPFYEIALSGKPTTRYLLSEMPPENRGFDGMNKPRQRFNDINGKPVGKDGTGRALYRDIFLNLDYSGKHLDELLIHELAHSMANHIFFRVDDHNADFKWAENFINRYW